MRVSADVQQSVKEQRTMISYKEWLLLCEHLNAATQQAIFDSYKNARYAQLQAVKQAFYK